MITIPVSHNESVKHEAKQLNLALEKLGKNASNMFYKITKRGAQV